MPEDTEEILDAVPMNSDGYTIVDATSAERLESIPEIPIGDLRIDSIAYVRKTDNWLNENPCKGFSVQQKRQCARRAQTGGEYCVIHAERHKSGSAHPAFKHGRYSRMPENLKGKYEEAQADPNLMKLRGDVEFIEVLFLQNLEEMGSVSPGIQIEKAKAAWDRYQSAMRKKNPEKMADALDELGAILNAGASTQAKWRENLDLIDRRRKLIEADTKQQLAMGQMVSADDLYTLLMAIQTLINDEVEDESIRRSIGDRFAELVTQRRGALSAG